MATKVGKYFFALLLLSYGVTASAQRIHVIARQPGYYTPAQQRPFQMQLKLRQLKEEFISKKLMLSPEQTNRFLVIFRRYEQETVAVRVLKRLNNSPQTENGADQVNKEIDYEYQLADIKKRYTLEFMKIMPPEKVSLIFKSEKIFNDEVRRNSKERDDGPIAPPGN